ncbi:MAG: COX15/CtaA family protein [Chloroflexota bacterium]|jgi:heme A synthase
MRVSTYQEVSASEKSASAIRRFSNLALSALISTILLIMVGSIVRVTGNGLGCPDWPLCHGRAIPPFLLSAWVEFLHRLFGAAVVVQAVALIYLSWRWFRPDKWIYRTAIFGGVVLTVQVILGGIHVIHELPRWTGWIHTGVAMLVAGTIAVWVALSRPETRRLGARTATMFKGTRLPMWTAIAAGASYVLMLTGSLVTRTGASLVCPDFPACGLETVPDNLQTIVLIQMTHRTAAFVVAFAVILTLWYLLRASGHDRGIQTAAWALIALLALQFGLGISNVLLALPMWSRVLHLGTAATIWVFLVILSVSLARGANQEIAVSGVASALAGKAESNSD